MSLIGYGLVLASVLLSLFEFESWSSFVRMAIPPVLQQQSNTSIEVCTGDFLRKSFENTQLCSTKVL